MYRHGVVYTVDAADSVAQAIAVSGGRIVYIGADAGVLGMIGKNCEPSTSAAAC